MLEKIISTGKKAITTVLLAGMLSCSNSTGPEEIKPDRMEPNRYAMLITTGKWKSYDPEYTEIGLGDLVLYIHEGKMKLSKYGLPPGFEYYDGHTGGVGNTLDLISGNTLYMRWAFGVLHEVAVGEDYKARTDKGLSIGDSKERFLELYPLAKKRKVHGCYADHIQNDVYTAGHLTVFIRDEEVKCMELGTTDFDRYYHDKDYAANPVGPDMGSVEWY